MRDFLKTSAIIARREFAAYFATPLAAVFITIFVAATGAFAFFIGGFFERGQANLDAFFVYHPVALPVPRAGRRHAALGGGAQERHHRAPDDVADLAG